jgi:hypothetical protein
MGGCRVKDDDVVKYVHKNISFGTGMRDGLTDSLPQH